MDKSKPFGLVIPKKNIAFQANKRSIFDADSDDEPSSKKPIPIPQAKPLSMVLKQKELGEDPSIYEYDSIYDDMKAQEVAKIAGPKDNKPSRYIDTLLKAADKRKKEYERRVERKVQVEREKEGDQFKDKEAFVTSSYKKKMQEMEEAEEKERRENMLNDMMDVTKQKDLSGFYRHFLKQSVGEEKVPEFGEKREIKEEPKSDDEDKKRTVPFKGIKRKNIESYEGKDRDSSPRKKEGSYKETKSSKALQSRPKIYRKGRSDSDDEETQNSSTEAANIIDPNLDVDSDIVSSDEEDKENNNSKSKDKSLKDAISENDSEVCSGSEKGSSKSKKNSKNIRKRTSDDSSDSSESSNESEENHPSSVNENSLNGRQVTQTVKTGEDEKPKPKRNLLEKRTVGEVFDAAQTRYFQRLAARNA